MKNGVNKHSSGLDRTQLSDLAALALGRSGADIERLVRQARQSARRNRRPLEWSDLEREIHGLVQNFPDDVRWAVAVHEAAHALVYIKLDIGTVKSASVGVGEKGVVHVELSRRTMETEDWLMRTIACLLAGRAAEHLVLGYVTLGSGGGEESDLAQATRLAMNAELAFGIGETTPLIYRNEAEQMRVLSFDPKLMAKVHDRLEQAERIALDMLAENKPKLLALAKRLFEARVLEGAEIISVIDTA